jgi:uncharacterized membrane protein (DUF373 family)
MPAVKETINAPSWQARVEKFEKFVVTALAILLVIIITIILGVVAYLFISRAEAVVISLNNLAEVQQAALRAFSGILLVMLGLELLDTVKVYFNEHSVRVEVILLVGLIAMGRNVLEIDMPHIEPLTLFGYSSLILALAISYFLVKRSHFSAIMFKQHGREDNG